MRQSLYLFSRGPVHTNAMLAILPSTCNEKYMTSPPYVELPGKGSR
ncbi:hypothetical protein PUATCC27989T_00071 [Phytobacter ursingii]|nr:hypothetical protein PUATCC27989T_00071 [Phytobacter ursingii]